MPFNRRHFLSAGAALGALAPGGAIAQGARRPESAVGRSIATGAELGLHPDGSRDQSKAIQAAIDKAAERGVGLSLASGRYLVQGLRMRSGTWITGMPGKTVLAQAGQGALLGADAVSDCRLENLVVEGAQALPGQGPQALIALQRVQKLLLTGLDVRGSRANGILLRSCQGTVRDCTIAEAALAGFLSIDADGIEIVHNTVADCANNGILVWREQSGDDGTIVANNRVMRIRATAGGTGENGNGVNVYRAGNVLVTGNRITDCAYSAIRGNTASNIQIVANNCQRLGEVALYAEFGFEGALIASNLVDDAATGISVTNFNEGGRLAVVQGNLIRNLVRREHEPEDKRGDGICVEADTVVTGNTIENAPNAGLLIGWGPYMREVLATSNIIRKTRVGIMITRDPGAGAALISQNLISGAREGAIRAMDKGTVVGPDLTQPGLLPGRITVVGNHVVDMVADR